MKKPLMVTEMATVQKEDGTIAATFGSGKLTSERYGWCVDRYLSVNQTKQASENTSRVTSDILKWSCTTGQRSASGPI